MKPLLRWLCLCLMAVLITGWIGQARSTAALGVEPGPLRPVTLEDDSGKDTEAEVSIHDVEQRTRQEYEPSFLENLMTLLMLVLLQAVLGFDNLLYISLESKNAPLDKQQSVRAWGIGLAIFLRIGLLFVLVQLQDFFDNTSVATVDTEYLKFKLSLHSLIVLGGGGFIIYTAMKEIWHMTHLGDHDHDGGHEKPKKSVGAVIFWILVMNVVFSFDSILSAMALSHVFWVMATAIIISGILMIVLSDQVSKFLAKNRMYEVLGLFVLFIVGIMLVSEGGHLAHMNLFGNDVEPMTKTTFYFVLAVLVLVDVVQGRYQKKLLAEKARKAAAV